MSIRQFVDGRKGKAEKAGRFETSGASGATGTGETSGTGGRASRKGVCKMFILRHILGCASSPTFVRLSFAYCSLIVRLTFGEGVCV